MEYRLNSSLPLSQSRLDGLLADFSGLNGLEDIVSDVMERLGARAHGSVSLVQGGKMSMGDFDMYFSELIRVELGKTLGIVRNKAIAKARAAGAGSAASAVLRRMYKDENAGNINIGGNRTRVSSMNRVVLPPNGGESGIRRKRTVKPRTKKIREYYGPDRGFILRMLESGRNEFYATGSGPAGRGSMATYGRRGAVTMKSFFHTLQSDMEQAAQELGHTLVGQVEKWLETKFSE